MRSLPDDRARDARSGPLSCVARRPLLTAAIRFKRKHISRLYPHAASI